MNISEFERTKPRKTYIALQNLIKKYSVESATEAFDESENIEKKMAREVKDDLPEAASNLEAFID